MYVQISIVMLLGLAAKNAILIVEFAKERYEKEGMSLVEAAIDEARVRFRPIMMTSFAFILGVVPLVVSKGAGAASQISLGMAVFSGMLAASGVGIFFIPMLYVLMQGITNFFSRKKKVEEKLPGTGEMREKTTPLQAETTELAEKTAAYTAEKAATLAAERTIAQLADKITACVEERIVVTEKDHQTQQERPNDQTPRKPGDRKGGS